MNEPTMDRDPFDRNLARLMKQLPEAPAASAVFEHALLERTRRVAMHKRRRRWIPLAAAAALLIGVGVGIMLLNAVVTKPVSNSAYPLAEDYEDGAVLARRVGLFRGAGEEEAESLYGNPIRYLARHGVDTSVPGLMQFYADLIRGTQTEVDEPRYACLDALVQRLGVRATPLLIRLHALDPEPEGRNMVLTFLRRSRDTTAFPYLVTTIETCDAKRLPALAGTLAVLGGPDADVARRLRARAGGLGILDPKREGYSPDAAAGVLRSLERLGDGDVKTDAARLLSSDPQVCLLEILPEHLESRRTLTEKALAGEPSFANSRLLAVLCRANDPRAADLLRLQLGDDDLALFGDTARVAGRHPTPALRPVLEAALARLHEKAGDQRVALLWALARCGDETATEKIREVVAGASEPMTFEWGVAALLDLGTGRPAVLQAIPDRPFVLGGLIALLEREPLPRGFEVRDKCRSLGDGDLRIALEIVGDHGWRAQPSDPDVSTRHRPASDYLIYCEEFGGKNRRYLRRPDLTHVRETLGDAGKPFGERLAALLLLRLVPGEEAAKVELARTVLEDLSARFVPFREVAVRLLGEVGTADAQALLAAHVLREPDAVIRAAALYRVWDQAAVVRLLSRVKKSDVQARGVLLDRMGMAGRPMKPEIGATLAAALESALSSDRRIARFHLAQAGRPMGRQAVADLLEEANGDDRVAAMAAEECLLTLGEKRLVTVWIRGLRSPDPVRRAVAAGRLAVWTGQGFDADAARWELWWKANRESFVLEPVRGWEPRKGVSSADLFEQEEE